MTEDLDDRVTCRGCNHLQRGYCVAPARAGLKHQYGKAEIGPTLASLPQRCLGFVPTVRKRATTSEAKP